MGFDPKEVDELLAATGRQCCICGELHQVQIHHIMPKEKGGSDAISNGISLCPNCHDEVHKDYVSGRTTRVYTTNELKKHKKRTIGRVRKEGKWSPDSVQWKEDKARVLSPQEGDLDAIVLRADHEFLACGGEQAGRGYRHVLQKTPDHIRANLGMGEWYALHRKYREAVPHLETVMTIADRDSAECRQAERVLEFVRHKLKRD